MTPTTSSRPVPDVHDRVAELQHAVAGAGDGRRPEWEIAGLQGLQVGVLRGGGLRRSGDPHGSDDLEEQRQDDDRP